MMSGISTKSLKPQRLSGWTQLPDDILFMIFDSIQSEQGIGGMVGPRAVCKAWREACCRYHAKVKKYIRKVDLAPLCRSFPSAKSLVIWPVGFIVWPQCLPDMSPLSQCSSLSKLRFERFEFPQPQDMDFLRQLPLETCSMVGSQPIAAGMPFLLEMVHSFTRLKHLKILPNDQEHAEECSHLFEKVCLRLPQLETLTLGRVSFKHRLECEGFVLRKLMVLELRFCGILPLWLSDLLTFLPALEKLSIVQPCSPSDWPFEQPCGKLDFANASTTLRSLRVVEAPIANCSHLQLSELVLGQTLLFGVSRQETVGTSNVSKIIAEQENLVKLELIEWDTPLDVKLMSQNRIRVLSLVDINFTALLKLIAEVDWEHVEHLHATADNETYSMKQVAHIRRFLQSLQFPRLKSVSGWVAQEILDIEAQ